MYAPLAMTILYYPKNDIKLQSYEIYDCCVSNIELFKALRICECCLEDNNDLQTY